MNPHVDGFGHLPRVTSTTAARSAERRRMAEGAGSGRAGRSGALATLRRTARLVDRRQAGLDPRPA